ncbi:MAG: bifunctional response regulator/alkaline phosphatase family protein [Bacteroidales bacterium]|nr:bifunctional response regulator/alkaline phosphatase family protein [Bacteroidales bacterium]
MSPNYKILWIDDEIEFLKIQILMLEEKGYIVDTINNGYDAVDIISNKEFDIVFLDENMPGLSGLDTLTKIKDIRPNLPIVMITKNEAENIMDEAIGRKISDYLIKPVKNQQIILTLKKHLQHKQLVTQTTTSQYQQTFTKLSMDINDARTWEEWKLIYTALVKWELELNEANDNTMDEVLLMQKSEANTAFAKFIQKNYVDWFHSKSDERPLMSHTLFKQRVIPMLRNNEKVVFILVDNLRFDQWKTLQPILSEYYNVDNEEIYCAILPTATQYARNSIFSGLMPSEIEKLFPDLWLNDEEDGGKNLNETELLTKFLKRQGFTDKFYYSKILNNKSGKKLLENKNQFLGNQLSILVYNFIDILSHARTDLKMIRELAKDEAAYRTLTISWFKHSPLLELFKELSTEKIKIVITTDHGTVRVQNPVKVVGDRQTSTNLRYKTGRNLNYNPKEVFEVRNPADAYLPSTNLTSSYIFAKGSDFFAYPNNYNHYVKYFKNTFQHGGISLEEMLIPFIVLSPK